MPLAGAKNRGGGGGVFPGEEKARRRRGSGGTARGRRELLEGRLVEVGGGQWRGGRRSSGSPAGSSCGGAAPAWEGGRRPTGELHWTTRNRVWGSICVEEGRGVGLHGGLRRSGGHGAGGGFLGGGRSSGGLRVRAREEWGGDGASGSQRRGKGARVGEERGWRPVSGQRRAQGRTGLLAF